MHRRATRDTTIDAEAHRQNNVLKFGVGSRLCAQPHPETFHVWSPPQVVLVLPPEGYLHCSTIVHVEADPRGLWSRQEVISFCADCSDQLPEQKMNRNCGCGCVANTAHCACNALPQDILNKQRQEDSRQMESFLWKRTNHGYMTNMAAWKALDSKPSKTLS